MAVILKKIFGHNKLRAIIIILSVFCLSACSIQPSFDSSKFPLSIKWAEPHKIYFQGKGIGAGIALMSSMGAMGMAIGVAIDEGISKDLTKSQIQSSQPLKNLLQNSIEESISDYNVIWLPITKSNEKQTHQVIAIEKLGFKLQPGKNDPVCGEMIIHIEFPNNKRQTIHYPDDFKQESDFRCTKYELEKLKNNSDYINHALEELVNTVLLLAIINMNENQFKPTLNKN